MRGWDEALVETILNPSIYGRQFPVSMVANFQVIMAILMESPIFPTQLLPNISIIASDSEVTKLSYH